MPEPTTAQLMEDLQAVVREAEALMEGTEAQAGEQFESLRGRASESLKQARSRLQDLEADALQGARDAAAATNDYVRKNPWQAVGIAVGVGLLVGLLLRRRD